MSKGRGHILGRIHAALADHPHSSRPEAVAGEGVFTPITDPLARFHAECDANRTELHIVTAANEADCLAAVLAREENGGGGVIYVQDATTLRALAARLPAATQSSLRFAPASPAGIASLTLCEALVARTGSVLVSSLSGGRAATILPPTHIVYAHTRQLHAEIDSALAQARTQSPSASLYSLITGPSRTSDIEKMLVLGAHGPKRLVVIVRADN